MNVITIEHYGVTFFFQDSNFTGCQTKLPTPSYNQLECQRFLKMAREEYETWPNIDEFEIYQKSNLKRLARCYRTHSDLGWCGVNLSDDISLVSHLIFLVKKQNKKIA